MRKSTVTRIFIGGILAVATGAAIGVGAFGIAIANNVFVMSGSNIVALRESALAVALLGVGAVSCIAIAGGLVAGFVAWIGALLGTSRAENRAWFLALLLLGIFNFGFVAMIAYIVAGPDGTTDRGVRTPAAPSLAVHA